MSDIQINQIISYRQMADFEKMSQPQAGMNFEKGDGCSVILMSVRVNAPFEDRISDDGLTIYYEGHDVQGDKLKKKDQSLVHPGGTLTQNGLFVTAINEAKKTGDYPLARVYEKLKMGVWNYRGLFELRDYSYIKKGDRKVFEYVLQITDQDLKVAKEHNDKPIKVDIEQTRQIPGKVKAEVYIRDKGMCVECGSKDNLHFDHILPYSLGGTSLKTENIRLLCARHNLQKSSKLDIY